MVQTPDDGFAWPHPVVPRRHRVASECARADLVAVGLGRGIVIADCGARDAACNFSGLRSAVDPEWRAGIDHGLPHLGGPKIGPDPVIQIDDYHLDVPRGQRCGKPVLPGRPAGRLLICERQDQPWSRSAAFRQRQQLQEISCNLVSLPTFRWALMGGHLDDD